MFKQLLSTLGELIYPNICFGCEKEPPINYSEFCLSCQLGVPLVNVLEDSKSYLIGKARFPENLAFFSYFYFAEGNMAQKIIHQIKYNSRKDLARRYGRKFGEVLTCLDWSSYIIIPVPIHPEKKIKRGYNQAEQIAIGLSERLKIPIRTNVLLRTIYDDSQTTKSKYQRQELKLMSFKAQKGETRTGEKILLVDDVVTTGSTILACVRQLQSLEVGEIKVASLAVAV